MSRKATSEYIGVKRRAYANAKSGKRKHLLDEVCETTDSLAGIASAISWKRADKLAKPLSIASLNTFSSTSASVCGVKPAVFIFLPFSIDIESY